MISDKELLRVFKDRWRYAEEELAPQYQAAREAHLFYDGNDMAYGINLHGGDGIVRQVIQLKTPKPIVDAINGLMIQTSTTINITPIIPEQEAQQLYSMLIDGAMDYFRELADMKSVEGVQHLEMLICGYGAIDNAITYCKNPDGQIAAEVLQYDEIAWDPQARGKNLLDARWVRRDKVFTMENALKKYKGSTEEDFETKEEADGINTRNHWANRYEYGDPRVERFIDAHTPNIEQLVTVSHYQWMEEETYYRAINPYYQLDPYTQEVVARHLTQMQRIYIEEMSQQTDYDEQKVEDMFEFNPAAPVLVMDDDQKREVEDVYKSYGVKLNVQEYDKECYYTAELTRNKVFKKFKSLDQQGFTIKFETGYYDKDRKIWYGMVKQMQEPVKYSNKAVTEMLYAIAVNSKGGVLYERSAVPNPKRFERDWAKNNAAIMVEDGSIDRIKPKAQAALPTGYENIYEISSSSTWEAAAVGREYLGMGELAQPSALLEAQRINRVVGTMAAYFDSIRLCKVHTARLWITFIRSLAQNNPGRLFPMITGMGEEVIAQLREDSLAPRYEVRMGEVPSSVAQEAENTQQLMGIAQVLISTAGINIYPAIIDTMQALPRNTKEAVKAAMAPPEPDPQQQQIQMQQLQLNMQEQQVRIAKDMADTEVKTISVDKTRADIAKSLTEAEQTRIENQIMKTPGAQTNVQTQVRI